MGLTPAVTVALISAAATTGAAIYSAQNQPSAPKLPKLPEVPKLPQTQSMAGSAQQADLRAKSAGGTILSDQRQNQQGIGDGANAVRKQLLGS